MESRAAIERGPNPDLSERGVSDRRDLMRCAACGALLATRNVSDQSPDFPGTLNLVPLLQRHEGDSLFQRADRLPRRPDAPPAIRRPSRLYPTVYGPNEQT